MSHKKKVKIAIQGILLCCMILAAACGRKEGQQLEMDVEVYVAEELDAVSAQLFPSDYKVSGEFLYCTYNQNGKTSISRIKLEELLVFQGEELLVSGSLRGYTVDYGQNLYTCTVSNGRMGVCKYSPEGELLFELFLDGEVPETTGIGGCLAADASGNVYVLVQDVIYRIDASGNLAGQYATEAYRKANEAKEYLLESRTGEIYYVNARQQQRVWKVSGDSNSLEEVTALGGYHGSMALYPGADRILVAGTDGILYGYGGEEAGTEPLLRWEDSNLNGNDVWQMAELPEGQLLVSTASGGFAEKSLYLLSKTPAGELPKKEIIVLASLFPSEMLQSAVVEFNRMDEAYHVTIESYGADPWYIGDQQENAGAYARLDGSVSSGPDKPDLLDLSWLDFYKYTEKGALEDLAPYLEKDGLDREDFLDNVLEGFTIDGELLCVPKQFSFWTVAGRSAEVGGLAGWSADRMMELAGTRTEGAVVDREDAVGMLRRFFADYYLEQFIDWETGACRFDSEEFCELLQWIEVYVGEDEFQLSVMEQMPQELFLREVNLYSFVDYLSCTFRFGEEITLVGLPSADGRIVSKARVSDAVGILSDAKHKDGAWAFLSYYLSREEDADQVEGFFTRESMLALQAEEAVEPRYVYEAGERMQWEDGSYVTDVKGYIYVDGEPVPFDFVPQEQVDAVMEAIRDIDFAPRRAQEESVVEIVAEEAASYFDGSKPLDEVVGIIQNRVGIVVQEQNL